MKLRTNVFAAVLLFTLPGALLAALPKTPPLRPLSDILRQVSSNDVKDVLAAAKLQAEDKVWMGEQGPAYKSAPPELNGDGSKRSDEVIFEGCFIPRKQKDTDPDDTTEVAIFSDDGCNVWVNGARVLNNFMRGQHLPDLDKGSVSFHPIKPPGGKWKTGHFYHIRIRYSNTIYNGGGDIDGCTLFTWHGGGRSPRLWLDVNNSGKPEGKLPGNVINGVRNYLPGYEGNAPKLTEQPTFAETLEAYTKDDPGQKMTLRLEGIGTDTPEITGVQFEITSVTQLDGICGNLYPLSVIRPVKKKMALRVF